MENLIKHIPQRSVYRASLTFRNLDLGKASTKPRRMNNSIWQSHGLELVNSNVSAKFHQNISYGSTDRASFIFFPNLDFDKASTDDKRHSAIPSVKSCQYRCVFTILSKYSFWFKSYGYWAFFACSQFGPRQSRDHWEMIFCILISKILSISTCR